MWSYVRHLKNAKNAKIKVALKSGGSVNRAQAFEMPVKVCKENIPLEGGLKGVFLVMLLKYESTN